MNEVQRIKDVYLKRDLSRKRELYSLFNPSALFMYQQTEKSVIAILKRYGLDELSGKKILDVGCGDGSRLHGFIRLGAHPANLYGIDILQDRIDKALEISPNIDFRLGNAEGLPYSDGSFDIVLLFTVFTSILDESMKKNIAGEVLRVLRPEGIIVWYDYQFNNPRNPDVKGVKASEINELFPECIIDLKRSTLAPPLTRAIAPYSFLICYLLEKIKIFNTHYLGAIRKK